MSEHEPSLERRSLDELTAKVADKIAGLMEAHRRGEDVGLADALVLIDGLRDEVSVEAIEEWKEEVRRDPVWKKLRLVASRPIGLLSLGPPKAKAKVETNLGPPKIEVAPSIFEEANEEGKEEREEIRRLEWSGAKLPSNYCPELSKQAPLDNARLFTRDMLELHAEGKKSGTGTYFHDGQWWQWNGAFYESAPEQRITDMVCGFMDKGKIKSDGRIGKVQAQDARPKSTVDIPPKQRGLG